MLAYSSIAHAGYVLVALTARSNTGTAAAMFYLAAYAFMNIGAFAVVRAFLGQGRAVPERSRTSPDSAQKQPFTAAMFTIFLLSLIGVPLTGGLLRQVLHLQSGARFEPGLADGARPAQQRGGGVSTTCGCW